MDQATKKKVLRKFTYGLFVITVADGGEANGFTANWITQASFEPPMVVFAMENDSRSIDMIERSTAFAVNILPAGTRELAGKLGRSSQQNPDKLADVEHEPGPATGSPILAESAGWLECRLVATTPAGDHTLLLGEVVEAGEKLDVAPLTLSDTGFRYFG
ncbi:MAG: flavin reductase family protein [Chloroflexia bacterium]